MCAKNAFGYGFETSPTCDSIIKSRPPAKLVVWLKPYKGFLTCPLRGYIPLIQPFSVSRRHLLWPLLTSAHTSISLSVNVAVKAYEQTSPGKTQRPSHLCLPHLRLCLPCMYWTLEIIAPSSSISASYVISVRQASTLFSASFRFYLTIDTLAVLLMILIGVNYYFPSHWLIVFVD